MEEGGSNIAKLDWGLVGWGIQQVLVVLEQLRKLPTLVYHLLLLTNQ
jgi:hypothetical protein